MVRKFITVGFLALVFGLAVASAQEIQPTADANQAVNIGASSATVNQQVNVTVPPVTALHNTAGALTFDIGDLGSQGTDWYCVQGPTSGGQIGTLNPATGDYELGLGSDFYGQTQVLPMGTYYSATSWPNVTIHGTQVTQYPPANVTDGVLVAGSKNYFVCYRTFILQTFSNYSNYDLQVTRSDAGANQAYPEPVYIQGNTYCSYTADAGTGLFALRPGSADPAHLIPASLGTGPTGAKAEECGQPGYKSWLDDLIVVAVKIDGEHYGTSSTQLTYTLVSADSPLNAPQ